MQDVFPSSPIDIALSEGREFLTMQEVCTILGRKSAAVYEWARLGKIPVIRIGTAKRAPAMFPVRAWKRWLETGSMDPDALKEFDPEEFVCEVKQAFAAGLTMIGQLISENQRR